MRPSPKASAAVGSGNMPAAGWLYASGLIGLMLVVLGAGRTELATGFWVIDETLRSIILGSKFRQRGRMMMQLHAFFTFTLLRMHLPCVDLHCDSWTGGRGLGCSMLGGG